MSDLLLAGATNIEYISLSSFVEIMPPATQHSTSKKTSKNSIEEAVECSKPTIPILLDTKCFIDKSLEVSWQDIKYAFMQNVFSEKLEDKKLYINIQRSIIHGVACIFLVLPCEKVIQWILLHMDSNNLVISSESGKDISPYHPHDLRSYYNMGIPRQYVGT